MLIDRRFVIPSDHIGVTAVRPHQSGSGMTHGEGLMEVVGDQELDSGLVDMTAGPLLRPYARVRSTQTAAAAAAAVHM